MVHDQIERWTGAPPTLWVTEGVLPLIWLALLVWLLVGSVRAGNASFGLLVLISFSSLFWQDAYINWGMYLLYNPHQALMPWGPTPFTAPRKVWWTIGGYGIFWLVAIPLTLRLAKLLCARIPSLGKTAAIILAGMPLFYLWDLLFEGLAINGGFYSYASYWGPAIVMATGNMPLVFPILFIASWATAAVLLIDWRNEEGQLRFERWFPLQRIVSPGAREAARIGIWVLVINLFHILFAILPLIAIRLAFLEPSPLVP